MAKVVGIIELTSKPGFPILKGKDGDETLTMKYTCAESDLPVLPDYGDSFSDTRYPYFAAMTGHILDVKDISRDNSGEFYHVELQFKDPQGGGGNAPSGPVMEEWDYDSQDYDVPVENHPNYRTKWNHKIIAIKGTTIAYSGWADATDTKISSPDSDKYKWQKPDETVPPGWDVWCAETEKGVESYRSGHTTVNWMKRCTDLKKLIASAQKDRTIVTPEKTFGRDGEWLRGSSKLKKEGRYWVMTVPFLNFEYINRKLYKVYGGQYANP